MNYKKIIKSRKMRLFLLEMLSFIPDKVMIKLQYKIKTNRKLNLKSPERFSEKLQWYKFNYKNSLMIECVDKYDVRDYVKDCGLENILNECYGVFNSPDEIDFDKLPNQFVLKDTLGGGGNSIIICEDKDKANIEEYKKAMNEWIKTKLKRSGGREWPYYSGKNHRIIIEKYLESNKSEEGLTDYKFFCFNGKAEYCLICTERFSDNGIKKGFFDMNLNPISIEINGYELKKYKMNKDVFSQLKNMAEKLSKEFPHVRVDLYYTSNRIIFGELTFYDASGYIDYKEFDYELGKKFELKKYS